MRAWTLPIMVLVLTLVVGGCGQKGPLYRDSEGASAAPETESAQDQQEREDNRD